MKGFPKRIATGKDLLHCLAMVQGGALAASDLSDAIAAIEERAYVTLPIYELSEDRKTAIVAACEVVEAGQKVENTASTAISAVAAIVADAAEAGLQRASIAMSLEAEGLEAEDASPSEASLLLAQDESLVEEPEATLPLVSVTLSRALPTGSTTLRVLSPIDPYAILGTTREQVSAMKEVLKQYE